MNDHMAGHTMQFGQEAAHITQMAHQVISFAQQSRDEREAAQYLHMAMKWLELAADLAPP
jgi:hypothetical protein